MVRTGAHDAVQLRDVYLVAVCARGHLIPEAAACKPHAGGERRTTRSSGAAGALRACHDGARDGVYGALDGLHHARSGHVHHLARRARCQRECRSASAARAQKGRSLSDLARLAALVRQRQLLQAAAARASARTTDTQSPRAAQPQQGAFLAPWRRGTGQLSRERAHGRQHIVDRLQALPPCRRAELSDKHLQRQRRRCVPSNAAASAGSCSAPLRRPLMPPADVSSTQATRRLSERADGGIRRRGGGGDFDASSARGAAREDQRTHRRPYFSGGSVPRRLATPPGRLQTAR
jgi:hypothetical protein